MPAPRFLIPVHSCWLGGQAAPRWGCWITCSGSNISQVPLDSVLLIGGIIVVTTVVNGQRSPVSPIKGKCTSGRLTSGCLVRGDLLVQCTVILRTSSPFKDNGLGGGKGGGGGELPSFHFVISKRIPPSSSRALGFFQDPAHAKFENKVLFELPEHMKNIPCLPEENASPPHV